MLVVCALFSGGCNLHANLDSVQYLDADTSSDLGAQPDGEPDSNSADAQQSDADASVDSDADTDGVAHECDLLGNEACDGDQRCVFDGEVETRVCVTADEVAGEKVEGEECATYQDCEAGLVCVDWALPDPRGSVCSKPCAQGSDVDCAPDEFCAQVGQPFGDEVGFCTSTCDILENELPEDEQACPGSQECAPDPFEKPGQDGQRDESDAQPSFPRNFRCLVNGGGAEKLLGAECLGAQLHENGCPTGLTCLPLAYVPELGGPGEVCLEACQESNPEECTYFDSYDTCRAITGTTAVGYCDN